LNGKRTAAETISNKTVIAKSVTIYPENDPQAISKFGDAAKKGVLVFEDAKIQEHYGNTFQKTDTINPDNKIFEKVEVEPSFPGGESEWKKYLERNLVGVNPAEKGAPNGTYTVYVQFVVDLEGKISNVRALTHIGYGMEDAVINIIKKGPRWIPAIQNGHKVKAYKKQPVNFVVASNNSQSNSFNDTDQTVPTNNPSFKLDTSIAKNMADEKLLVIDSKVLGLLKDHIKDLEMKNVVSITLLNEENAIKKYGSQGKNGAFEFYTFKSDPKDYTYPTPTRGIQPARVTFEETDVPASFPGGDAKWKKYLSQTLGGYNPADSGAAEGSYKVMAQFIVDIDGSLINIKALTNFGFGMENKVIEMLKNGPKWIPAMKNGRKVSSFVKQPVTFVIQEENEEDNNKIKNSSNISSIAYIENPATYPLFPGGQTAWKSFLEKSIDTKSFVLKNDPNVSLTWIEFIVNEDGSLSNFKPLTKSPFGKEFEAIRILKLSPNWIPATKNGKKVKYKWVQAFSFSITSLRQPNRVSLIVSPEENIVQGLGQIEFVYYLPTPKTNISTSNKIETLQNVEIGSLEWKRYFERSVNIPLINANDNITIGEGTYNLLFQFTRNDDGTLNDIKCLNPHFSNSKISEQITDVFKHIIKTSQNENDASRKTRYYVQPLKFLVYKQNAG
jgi:hypothetical protein